MRMHGGLLYIAFCLSVRIKNSLEKNHISKSIVPRVMKIVRGIDLVGLLIDLKGQCHRSKVKVTR